ncbi:hypothetical protein AB0D04_32490 [Streptomyces sp. NPDC048483]|uniref:hypothetical protein n=1 Tax=Streptomyces sp. NPDC048483 TaxID=3154927 RepID=UPI00343ABF77
MTALLDTPSRTECRDPRALLNAVRAHVKECTYNVFESPGSQGDLWDREIALLLRDAVPVRSLAERILANAVAYTITAMEPAFFAVLMVSFFAMSGTETPLLLTARGRR